MSPKDMLSNSTLITEVSVFFRNNRLDKLRRYSDG